MKYFKRNWDESRGDEFDHWGASRWYFETSDTGDVTRQVEIYSNGPTIRYDELNLEDQYGGLAEKPLNIEEFIDFKIQKDEFEIAWNSNTL